MTRAVEGASRARRSLRIGMFSECYEPVRNGVTTSVDTLVRQLRRLRHRVVLVAPHYAHHVDETPFVLRVPSIQTWINKDYPVAYPFYPRLRRQFRELAPDVVHSHNPFFVGVLAARLAAQHDVPLVSTYHTLYNHYGHYLFFLPDAVVQALLKWWIPDYYNRCRHVIVPSRVAEASLRGYGVDAPITVIPTAVPLANPADRQPRVRAETRERLGVPNDAVMLLYVGRLAQEKNIELVMDAFAACAARFPSVWLVVVGGGPHLDACRRHALSLPCRERVLMAGPMPHPALGPVYAAADLFVFGSTTETQGLVMAEARAAGTPCVVARGGGASETVRDGDDGLVVDADRAALAAAIYGLVSNPARLAAMSEACLRNAHSYTPEAMAAQVVSVYRSVALSAAATREK